MLLLYLCLEETLIEFFSLVLSNLYSLLCWVHTRAVSINPRKIHAHQVYKSCRFLALRSHADFDFS